MQLIIKIVLGIIATGLVLAGLFYGSIIWLFSSAPCSYDKDYAQERVHSFLEQYEVDKSKLKFVSFNGETCRADFIYNERHQIIVIDDFVKGAKVTGDLSEIINSGT